MTLEAGILLFLIGNVATAIFFIFLFKIEESDRNDTKDTKNKRENDQFPWR